MRAGLATAASQIGRAAIQMASTVILARLLTPQDYGLVGMAIVVVGLAQMFKDAGLSSAVVQQPEISHEQVSTLFWATILVSGAIASCLGLTAPLIAAFYRTPELGPITVALAGSLAISGVSLQHEALLRRHMRFGALGIALLVSQAANAACAVVAASLGLGYWALVIGATAGAVAMTGMVFYMCPWLPGLPKRATGARRMLAFGGDVTAFNFVNYFSRNGDNILIGRFLGSEMLGIYSRAYQLFTLPMTQIRGPIVNVALPAMSGLGKDDRKYAAYYRHLVGLLAMFTVPLAVYSIADAEWLVDVLLGGRWGAVAPVFRVLAVTGVLQAITSTNGVVLLSKGLSRRYLVYGIINALLMTLSFVAGLPFGILGVATAYTIANVLFLLPSVHFALLPTCVGLRDFASSAARAIVASFLAAACATAILRLSPEATRPHLLALVTFATVYIVVMLTGASTREMLRLVFRSRAGEVAPALREDVA